MPPRPGDPHRSDSRSRRPGNSSQYPAGPAYPPGFVPGPAPPPGYDLATPVYGYVPPSQAGFFYAPRPVPQYASVPRVQAELPPVIIDRQVEEVFDDEPVPDTSSTTQEWVNEQEGNVGGYRNADSAVSNNRSGLSSSRAPPSSYNASIAPSQSASQVTARGRAPSRSRNAIPSDLSYGQSNQRTTSDMSYRGMSRDPRDGSDVSYPGMNRGRRDEDGSDVSYPGMSRDPRDGSDVSYPRMSRGRPDEDRSDVNPLDAVDGLLRGDYVLQPVDRAGSDYVLQPVSNYRRAYDMRAMNNALPQRQVHSSSHYATQTVEEVSHQQFVIATANGDILVASAYCARRVTHTLSAYTSHQISQPQVMPYGNAYAPGPSRRNSSRASQSRYVADPYAAYRGDDFPPGYCHVITINGEQKVAHGLHLALAGKAYQPDGEGGFIHMNGFGDPDSMKCRIPYAVVKKSVYSRGQIEIILSHAGPDGRIDAEHFPDYVAGRGMRPTLLGMVRDDSAVSGGASDGEERGRGRVSSSRGTSTVRAPSTVRALSTVRGPPTVRTASVAPSERSGRTSSDLPTGRLGRIPSVAPSDRRLGRAPSVAPSGRSERTSDAPSGRSGRTSSVAPSSRNQQIERTQQSRRSVAPPSSFRGPADNNHQMARTSNDLVDRATAYQNAADASSIAPSYSTARSEYSNAPSEYTMDCGSIAPSESASQALSGRGRTSTSSRAPPSSYHGSREVARTSNAVVNTGNDQSSSRGRRSDSRAPDAGSSRRSESRAGREGGEMVRRSSSRAPERSDKGKGKAGYTMAEKIALKLGAKPPGDEEKKRRGGA